MDKSRNESLLARREAAVARGVSLAHPVFVERAEGVWVWDPEGKRYMDMLSAYSALNHGHRHPQWQPARIHHPHRRRAIHFHPPPGAFVVTP